MLTLLSMALGCAHVDVPETGLPDIEDVETGQDSGDTETADDTDVDTSIDTGTDTGTDTGADTTTDTGSDTATDTDTETADTDVECSVSVPATTVVINDEAMSSEDGLTAWICGNQILSFAGTGGTFFLDDRAEVVLSGGGNTVYAKANARVHNFGEGNRIVVEDGTDLRDESDAGASVGVCDPLAYDLTAAPDVGCR